jgi:type IV pilus assembly protein PilA
MKKLHARKGGFTLIELMIVVAIIGILAAIAIPNFLRFQLKAKSSEGKTNIAAIRTAEQSYYSEFGTYVSTANATPNSPPTSAKQAFGSPDPGLDRIGWSPEGQVYFNYMVGIDGGGIGTAFMASAEADIDANGTSQVWGYHRPANSSTPAVPGVHPGTGTCTVTGLGVTSQVGPCDGSGAAVFGQSEF